MLISRGEIGTNSSRSRRRKHGALRKLAELQRRFVLLDSLQKETSCEQLGRKAARPVEGRSGQRMREEGRERERRKGKHTCATAFIDHARSLQAMYLPGSPPRKSSLSNERDCASTFPTPNAEPCSCEEHRAGRRARDGARRRGVCQSARGPAGAWYRKVSRQTRGC
jgi:hypothetical protein